MLYVNGAAGNLAAIYPIRRTSAPRRSQSSTCFWETGSWPPTGHLRRPAPGLASGREKVSSRPLAGKGFGWDDSLGSYLQADKGDSGTIRFPIRFAIINDDLALWSAPVELFCEISMNVRNRPPYPHTFYFGYANGWLGYLATRQAFSEGGYETQTNPFTDRVEEDLTKTVLTYLDDHGR